MAEWQPSGMLLTSINEHTAPVNSLAYLYNNKFVSGSDDGTVRLFSLLSLKTNFTHRSLSVADMGQMLNRPDVEVKKVKFMPELSKIAVFTNTDTLVTLDPEKPNKISQRFISSAKIRNGEVYNTAQFSNCLSFISEESELVIVDVRMSQPVMRCALNKARGVPSGVKFLESSW